MHQKVGDALRFGLAGVVGHRLRVKRLGVDVESASWFHHVPDYETNRKSDRGYDFKVQQRFAAHAPDLLHVLHPGNAGNHGAKDHQSDDHGDEADERIAERLHGDRSGRAEIAQSNGDRDGEQHLSREALVDRPSLRLQAYLRCKSRHE